ncbi:hypothetical protein SEUCBS139899_001188 [Sporothrix eucalyptigena]|uniref:Uncharacterized protein n=1 Tax=Sporothrix eucalyptigena TaxID=1812306 RepID=A0ABP0BRN5_9PEZI
MAIAPTSRLRTVAIITAVAAAGIGLTVRHQANALRANELAQQRARSSSTTPATPGSNNLYVSVDRSGGGI